MLYASEWESGLRTFKIMAFFADIKDAEALKRSIQS